MIWIAAQVSSQNSDGTRHRLVIFLADLEKKIFTTLLNHSHLVIKRDNSKCLQRRNEWENHNKGIVMLLQCHSCVIPVTLSYVEEDASRIEQGKEEHHSRSWTHGKNYHKNDSLVPGEYITHGCPSTALKITEPSHVSESLSCLR